MAIAKGEKVHIITRRLFESDLRRHFAGVVEDVALPLIRVRGYAYVFDHAQNQFICHDEERIRVFSAPDSSQIVNILPPKTRMANLRYELDHIGRRLMVDGAGFQLNISEFGAKR